MSTKAKTATRKAADALCSRTVTLDKIRKDLRMRGYRVTGQRLIIAEEFINRFGHVRISELHAIVKKRNGSISLSTVYNTMGLMEEIGLIKRIPTGQNEAIYDSNVEPHVNLVCPVCGFVEDIFVSANLFSRIKSIAFEKGRMDPKVEITVQAVCKKHL